MAAAATDGFELRYRTPPGWAAGMVAHVPELLIEQAHLEKKAAAAAAAFLFRLPQELRLQRELSALAREELVHFERTLRLLAARGIALREQRPCAYAGRLKAAVSPHMPLRLLDELLVCAIIEARSCERMGLLADALGASDAEAAEFYRDLVAAEARHAPAYLEAALGSFPRAEVTRRWQALAEHEAAVLAALPWEARLHGGCGGATA